MKKHTNSSKKVTKKRQESTDGKPSFAYWFQYGQTEMGAKCLAEDMMRWAKEEEAFSIPEYLMENNIPHQRYYEWKAKFPFLKEAHEFAKMCIGIRRERGIIKGDYNAAAVIPVMSYYSKEWKEMDVWRSELRKKEDAHHGPAQLTILMEAAPQSDIVPFKMEAKEEDGES